MKHDPRQVEMFREEEMMPPCVILNGTIYMRSDQVLQISAGPLRDQVCKNLQAEMGTPYTVDAGTIAASDIGDASIPAVCMQPTTIIHTGNLPRSNKHCLVYCGDRCNCQRGGLSLTGFRPEFYEPYVEGMSPGEWAIKYEQLRKDSNK